jgi:hypothetical protein
MKPSRLRVFDGLRITTEHINHLQTAFSSGIEDLRAAAGLGTVQHGLEVTVANGQLTVAPGLAFDGHGNRIVCDEPQSLPVSFAPGHPAQYVCLAYRSVEDGQVEGVSTLIFDSCALSLQPELPPATDLTQVLLAKVVDTGTGIALEPPVEPAPPAAGSEPPRPTAASPIRVRQGVTRLTAPPVDVQFADLPNVLKSQPLDLDSAPVGVTAHVLMTATITLPAAPAAPPEAPAAPADNAAAGAAPASPPPPPEAAYRFDCRADGEATVDDRGVSQFSISCSSSPDVSERDLGRLFLDLPDAAGLDPLRSAYLAVRLVKPSSGPLQVVCVLEWSGVLDDPSIAELRDRNPSLSWQALVAWKAIGVSDSQ